MYGLNESRLIKKHLLNASLVQAHELYKPLFILCARITILAEFLLPILSMMAIMASLNSRLDLKIEGRIWVIFVCAKAQLLRVTLT